MLRSALEASSDRRRQKHLRRGIAESPHCGRRAAAPGSRQSFRYPRRDDRRSCHELERHRKTGEVARAEDKRSGIRARTGSRTRPAGSAGRNVTRVRWLFAQRAGDPHPSLSSRNTTLSRQLNFRVADNRSEEHTSELQSLMRNSYAVFCLKKKNNSKTKTK